MLVYVVEVQTGSVFVGGGGGGGVIIGFVSELEDPPPPQPDNKIIDKKITLFNNLFRNCPIDIKFFHETPNS